MKKVGHRTPGAKLIGSLKGKVRLKGKTLSTSLKWQAASPSKTTQPTNSSRRRASSTASPS
jgi:hypothetical protein